MGGLRLRGSDVYAGGRLSLPDLIDAATGAVKIVSILGS